MIARSFPGMTQWMTTQAVQVTQQALRMPTSHEGRAAEVSVVDRDPASSWYSDWTLHVTSRSPAGGTRGAFGCLLADGHQRHRNVTSCSRCERCRTPTTVHLPKTLRNRVAACMSGALEGSVDHCQDWVYLRNFLTAGPRATFSRRADHRQGFSWLKFHAQAFQARCLVSAVQSLLVRCIRRSLRHALSNSHGWLLFPRLSLRCSCLAASFARESTDSPFGGMGTAIFVPGLAELGTASWNSCPASVPFWDVDADGCTAVFFLYAAWHTGVNSLLSPPSSRSLRTDHTLHRLKVSLRRPPCGINEALSLPPGADDASFLFPLWHDHTQGTRRQERSRDTPCSEASRTVGRIRTTFCDHERYRLSGLAAFRDGHRKWHLGETEYTESLPSLKPRWNFHLPLATLSHPQVHGTQEESSVLLTRVASATPPSSATQCR